jgi:hypothetical protein
MPAEADPVAGEAAVLPPRFKAGDCAAPFALDPNVRPNGTGGTVSPFIDICGTCGDALVGGGVISPPIVSGRGCGIAMGRNIAANIAPNPSSGCDVAAPACAPEGCAAAAIEELATNVTIRVLTNLAQNK